MIKLTVEVAKTMARLAEPFEASEVGWKPQTISGNRALAVAFVDARAVMDRLDEVLGLGGWQTAHRELADGVVCKLRYRLGGEWHEHEDVGSFSEQPDGGDRLKSAFSDSLKRTAVRVGVGRYLYRLPKQWCDWDPKARKFVKEPALPAWALPSAEQLAVREWSAWLAMGPTLEQFNAEMAAFAELKGGSRKLVWALLSEHAKELGWTLDTEKKVWEAK